MKTSLILILILCTFILKGQQISRTHLASASNFSKDNKGSSINWTMGNIFVETIQEEQHLTGGFQQGDLNLVQDSRQALRDTATTHPPQKGVIPLTLYRQDAFSIIAFPNPTTDQLSLKLPKPISAIAIIFDSAGKKLFQHSINTSDGDQIDLPQVEKLPSGMYFIHLYQEKNKVLSKSFVKI